MDSGRKEGDDDHACSGGKAGHGVDSVVAEDRSRDGEGLRDGICLEWPGERHHLDFPTCADGS